MNTAINIKHQLLCAWGGLAFVVALTVGWFLLGGYVPPHAPTNSAIQTAAWYKANHTSIIGGLVISVIGMALLTPFNAVVSIQMARIEGRWPVLAAAALIGGTLTLIEVLVAFSFWATAAFRPDRDPELIQLLNDSGWIWMFWVASVSSLQLIALGICILSDKRVQPVFPRWVAYVSFWVALLISTDNFMPFFQTGPFAWNGLLVFYMPCTSFFVWLIIMTVVLQKVIRKQALEEDKDIVAP